MEHSLIVAHSSLLNHLTAIKLALELLERGRPLSSTQQELVQVALGAANAAVTESVMP